MHVPQLYNYVVHIYNPLSVNLLRVVHQMLGINFMKRVH
jgi:hypothetical protein